MGQHAFNTAYSAFYFQVSCGLPVDDDIIPEAFDIGNVIEKDLHHLPFSAEVKEARRVVVQLRVRGAYLPEFVYSFHEPLEGDRLHQVVNSIKFKCLCSIVPVTSDENHPRGSPDGPDHLRTQHLRDTDVEKHQVNLHRVQHLYCLKGITACSCNL